MILPITAYQVSCDECGCDLEIEEGCRAAFNSPTEAMRTAAELGWRKVNPGNWLVCDECAEKILKEEKEVEILPIIKQ